MRTRWHSVGRSVATGLAAMAVVTAVAGSGGPVAASDPTPPPSGPLGGLVGLLYGVVQTVEGVVGAIVPTGWLFDNSVTTMNEVRATIGAPHVAARLHRPGRRRRARRHRRRAGPGADLGQRRQRSGPVLREPVADLRYLDTFGHGTHMAGIIAGNDPSALLALGEFQGVAPGRAADQPQGAASDGGVDVSQVIAAIDWVVEHRNDDPANPIRVLNLSYGTDGVQDYQLDPLTHAVENAWRAGIVVVVSGGNAGTDAPASSTTRRTTRTSSPSARPTPGARRCTRDDVVPAFSSRGDASRRVDLVAPGRSIVSLRDPGSYLDAAHPRRARSAAGTSRAAAPRRRPPWCPAPSRCCCEQPAQPHPGPGQGPAAQHRRRRCRPPTPPGVAPASSTSSRRALLPRSRRTTQTWPASTGLGSLEAARGTPARGRRRRRAAPVSATCWARGTRPSGHRPAVPARPGPAARWNGRDWTGGCWCASTVGRRHVGGSFVGRSFVGRSVRGRAGPGPVGRGPAARGRVDGWAGRSWAGRSWAGLNWSAVTGADRSAHAVSPP